MILYGRNTLYPSWSDPATGPRTVSLWRTTSADSYLRLANADTDCPPDPTTLVLDDGVTEPFRYQFYRVNRAPGREANAPLRAWLIKGRARTSYSVSWVSGSERYVEFLPYLYVGRTFNPSDYNDFRDGDAPNADDGSSYPINPPDYAPVQGGDFLPSSGSFVAYYYVSALVQTVGSNNYRCGLACRVAVSSIDTVVDVQWFYVVFQNRICLAAVPLAQAPGWQNLQWVRMEESGSSLVFKAGGSVFHTMAGNLGSWTPYQLMQMETVLPSAGNGNLVAEWSYLGGQLYSGFIPIGRVAGVRSAYTQQTFWLTLTDSTPQRIRVKSGIPSVVAPLRFRSGSTLYPAESLSDGFYRPSGNPQNPNWEVEYTLQNTMSVLQLMEHTDLENIPADSFVEARWVSSSSGQVGTVAQTEFRAGNSTNPVQVYLRRGTQETLLYTFNAPPGGWNGTAWNPFDWLRNAPRGAHQLVFRLSGAPDAVLDGTVLMNPTVSLSWVSAPARRLGQTFTVQTVASKSDANLIVETVQNDVVLQRGSYTPPPRGYWDNDTVTTSWGANVPYGVFTVRARLETAEATVSGQVLEPYLEMQWLSEPYQPIGGIFSFRVRVFYINAPLQVYEVRGTTETLIATYNPPSGGWNGEWKKILLAANAPAGTVRFVARCGDLETQLIGEVLGVAPPETPYAFYHRLTIGLPANYWVIRSPSRALARELHGQPLIRLGAGWGLQHTHQGRYWEIYL